MYEKVNGQWQRRGEDVLYGKVNGAWRKIDRAALSAERYACEHRSVKYVSLGDSIAAGHTINDDWAKNYGEGSQYGKNGNTETALVPDCYTDLIRRELIGIYGEDRVRVKSFARSGDTVADLMEKLNHDTVRSAIREATLVTVCIGANDVLEPAMSHLPDYINTGDMSALEAVIRNNLVTLESDSAPNSYRVLFDKLNGINPKATYVFTTVYNPYKHLYLAPSNVANDYKDGFLGPLMWAIPDSVGSVVANAIRGAFMDSDVVRNLFDRVNGLSAYAENYVTRLNTVLRSKVEAYGQDNFLLADTKAVFDPVPDRPIDAPKHYNDLVNVEFTRGYTVNDMDWGRFWDGVDFTAALGGMDEVAAEIIDTIVTEVITPDVDPHPEWYGHHALKCAFADALDWADLPRRTVRYEANGGSGAMAEQVVVALDGMAAYVHLAENTFAAPTDGYNKVGWNTAADGSAAAYGNRQLVGLTEDLTLYAQWSRNCTLFYTHTNDTSASDSDTGHQECYGLWIDWNNDGSFTDDELQGKLSSFTNPGYSITVPYGTQIHVEVSDYDGALFADAEECFVSVNGVQLAAKDTSADHTFPITADTTVDFHWGRDYSNPIGQKSWWRCYISTK